MSRDILLAGASPGDVGGNSVSSDVMLAALRPLGPVGVLSHEVSAVPRIRESSRGGLAHLAIGTQPIVPHGEALLAGRLFRHQIRAWSCAWVVNSRYAGALAAAGVPYVIWEATTIRDELRATSIAATRRAGTGSGAGLALHRALLPLGERLERAIYRRAAAVYAMSDYSRELVTAAHPLHEGTVRVLPHPPSPTFLAALRRAPALATAHEGGFRLLFVGRVDDPRKNFPLLLDAIGILQGRRADVSLTVVGPHTDRWRASLPEGRGGARITLAGRVSVVDLVSAYRTHDALVLTSRQEGFGIVVAEALHAGLPVVSTRSGGPEGVLRESGAGILVDHSAAAVADAVDALRCDERRRRELAERALRYARDQLSFERFAAQVADITAEVRAGGSPIRTRPPRWHTAPRGQRSGAI